MEEAFCRVYGFTAEPVVFSEDAKKQIDETAKTLSGWEWLYGQKLPFSVSLEDRFSWGGIQLQLQVTSGMIAAVKVYTDAMQWQLAANVEKCLLGLPFSTDAMCNAFASGLDAAIAADLSKLVAQSDL